MAWGENSYGERDVPPELTNACIVAAGSGHNIAVLADGTLKDWGGNGYSPPAGLGNIKSISEREALTLALLSNGTVTAWGANPYGGRDVPAGLGNVMAVAAGNYHGLALLSDGTVVGWGGQDGAGNVPTGLAGVVAIAAGISHSLALKSDGTVVGWGWNNNGQASVPAGLSGVRAISAGGYHSMALKTDGTVIVWGGQDDSVQPPAGLSEIAAISAGTWHNLALKSNGTVVAWGSNSRGQCNIPAGLKDVVAISAGQLHSVALTTSLLPSILIPPVNSTADAGASASFSVTATGPGVLAYQWLKDGSVIVGATASTLSLSNLDSTNAGNYAAVVSNFSGSVTSAPASLQVLTAGNEGGTLVSLSSVDPPPGFHNLSAVSASSSAVVALRTDGTVAAYVTSPGFGDGIANTPPGLAGVVAIAVGEGFALALRNDSTVVAWGGFISAPPDGLSNVISIGAGDKRAYAAKGDGTVVSWGSGPAPPALSDVVAVSGGYDSGLALKADGTVVQWGLLLPGILAGETNLVAITLGDGSFGGVYPLGLRADGTVAGSGVPPDLSGVTAISSSRGYGLALKSDGSVVGLSGAIITASLSHIRAIAANGGYGLVITRWPFIKKQPESVTVQPGSSVIFTVEVKGSGPFSFQWRKDGTDLPGANGPSLTVQNSSSANIGAYTVSVSNSSGSVTSSPALLNHFGAPQITIQPQSQKVFSGAKVGFSTAALGAEPLLFQWYHSGISIPDATNRDLVIADASSNDAGSYAVVVSNAQGQETSLTATLEITSPPTWRLSPPGIVVSFGGPALPPGLTSVVAVAAGSTHGLALLNDGTVVGWGSDFLGPVSIPTRLSNVVAISAGENLSLALQADGTVRGWGSSGSAVPPGLYGVIGIAAGDHHSLAIKSDGKVIAWGSGVTGPDAPPHSATNALTVDAGFQSDVALRNDGTVVTWGGLLNPGGLYQSGLSNITAVSLGRRDILALRNDGTVVGGPDGLSGVVAIDGGGQSGLALKNDGTVVGWGGINPAPGLSNVTAISVGGFGLVITTTNPPPPELGARLLSNGEFEIYSRVSVPGYILEAAGSHSQPFAEVSGYTNSFTFTNEDTSGFRLSDPGTMQLFRLRKQ